MIEFYHQHFKSNYTTKIKQLISDIERLLYLENISVDNDFKEVLDSQFRLNLNISLWERVNCLYNTLYRNSGKISDTLVKFINKTKQPKKIYRFVDTFAGCGGLSLGVSRAGFNPVLVNEIEPKFLETYYFNHDLHLDNYKCCDIKELTTLEFLPTDDLQDLDLVVGGPPCQGFSMANRQRVIDDPRNKLYKYFLELLSLSRPKFFIMENVKGMINKSEEIIDNFTSTLGGEYSIDIVLLNAKDYGVPQNRERVFVIGSRVKAHSASNIISNILKNKKEIVTLNESIFDLPILEPKTEKNTRGLENEKIGYKFTKIKTVRSKFSRSLGSVNIEYLSNHINRYNNNRDVEIFSRLPQGCNSLHESISDIMPYSNRNHMFKDKYFKLDAGKPSKTITSHMKFDCNMYIHPTQSRGLSPREAARIQTFPDDYVFMGANNNWYAQIGNAVPVSLAEAIASSIMQRLKK